MKPPGLGDPTVHKITENVYAITNLYHTSEGFGTNAGIIFTSLAVVFIDSSMTIASGEFLWQTASERLTGQEDLYLILTHHHSDHVFGMRVLKEKGVKVIAHSGVREFLENDDGRYKRFIVEKCGWDQQKGDELLGDVLLSLPDQLIEEDTVLRLDNDEIHLLVTPGHVPSELSVYHPASRTLFAGDTIYEGTPPTTRFGGPEEWRVWISQLERLKRLEIDVICPGHGNLCSKQEIDRNIAHLRGLL
ncbi:MBL fold metallo-hydrolase [Dehalococcoidia bacterium]|nr:MBL fold metallo-hydrolase [Dehalococcoidia bacterium]MCL0064871.1 MBL fold metallo-hydrolase [Dehalococcoidia bacterium]